MPEINPWGAGLVTVIKRAMQILRLDGPDVTEALGARLAGCVRAGDVIALRGDLGAGKTTLARGLVRTLTGKPDDVVPSPTFTLVQTYDTPAGLLWHFDLYRIEDPREVWALGLEEALATGISLIEWPERAESVLPEDRLDIGLTMTMVGGEDSRQAELRGGPSWKERLGS